LCRLERAGEGGAAQKVEEDAGGDPATGPAEPGTSAACSSGDCCPNDSNKTQPGVCGCNVAETDSDRDGVADCIDSAPNGWRRQLTLDGSQVAEPLTDFPVLIRITDDHVQSQAAPSGSDIHFLAADETSPLDHELESYDAASGALVAWVRMPTLSSGADSLLYLRYGDGQDDRSNATGVWSQFHNVWHMAQSPGLGSGAIKDSTRRADGSARGDMTSANVESAVSGNGISFDGIDDQILFNNDILGSGESTISAWVKQSPGARGLGHAVIALGGQAANEGRFLITLERASGTSEVGFYGNDLHAQAVSNDRWTHVVWAWNGHHSSIFIDGERIEGPTPHTGANTRGNFGRIGNSTFGAPGNDYFLLGALDEVRVAEIAHSSEWVAAEYNNQRPGSTFLKNIAAAEPASGP
jgi:biopolymer transport protein ExbB